MGHLEVGGRAQRLPSRCARPLPAGEHARRLRARVPQIDDRERAAREFALAALVVPIGQMFAPFSAFGKIKRSARPPFLLGRALAPLSNHRAQFRELVLNKDQWRLFLDQTRWRVD